MVSQVNTVAFEGMNTTTVDVQVHISSGLPSFNVVGLADKAVAESRERIRAALTSIGMALPPSRITVNLSPADLVKEGSHYDLAIASGILAAMGAIPMDVLENYVVMGELALDGGIRGVAGVLPSAIYANSLGKGIICPEINGTEACWAGEELEVLAPSNILNLMNHFKGSQILQRPSKQIIEEDKTPYPDLKDIKGQESAKRALEIAAAGGHNMLMIGPPGSGKSMLAARLPGILPPLNSSELLDVSMINSITNNLNGKELEAKRPFRDPHHSCSMAAMIGGGRKATPGEVTLAHQGVLFLDELPEFPRNVLDSLRQPLENSKVTVSRAQAHVTYPANFQFIAAMNPCRCGYLGDQSRSCNKAPRCGGDYQSKISGPLYDRIDIHVEVPQVTPSDLTKEPAKEGSEEVSNRVRKAREIQLERYKSHNISYNSQADGEVLLNYVKLDKESQALLEKAYDKLNLSMRGYNRVLRVARTIADLSANDNITKADLAEALSYRQLGLNVG